MMLGYRIAFAMLPVLAAGMAVAHENAASGVAAGAGAAAKVVKVDVMEGGGTMLFSPARLDVAKGATIRFIVHNGGALPHEFIIGTKAENRAHLAMMAEMPGMLHHDANAISVKAGATRSLTWRFARTGSFEFACLLPGHYEAGMHGVVAVR